MRGNTKRQYVIRDEGVIIEVVKEQETLEPVPGVNVSALQNVNWHIYYGHLEKAAKRVVGYVAGEQFPRNSLETWWALFEFRFPVQGNHKATAVIMLPWDRHQGITVYCTDSELERIQEVVDSFAKAIGNIR